MLLLATTAVGALIWKTYSDLLPIPTSLSLPTSGLRKMQVVDRNHRPLTVTYQNRWNSHDYLALHEFPAILRQAFIVSEDQRFYRHEGVDWIARLHALWQNFMAWRSVRGASTISEQVIRMWHPRARTLWSRWLEGLEAVRLENAFSKGQILEFYLNQVPYVGQRRGVVQAARYFFDRDPETLSTAEMLALVVMVRAPSRLDLRRQPAGLMRAIAWLADRLCQFRIISPRQYQAVLDADFQIQESRLPVRANHFIQYLSQLDPATQFQDGARLHTTLDSGLQHLVQTILDQRIKDLWESGAQNGSVLIVDHQQDEILAWVNSGAYRDDVPVSWIDGVTTLRQPGSTLKPLLYALALEKGWTAATLVDDSPLSKPVGQGLHSYHNYSRNYYGPLRVREALGNSLNIPAVRAVQFVGVENFLDCLHALGIRSLQQHPDYYGDGLALGNGEITLLELVRVYTVLARQGIYRPLQYLMTEASRPRETRTIFSVETASLVGHILSDPEARRLEFGNGSLLRFPIQTAVKTGTSSDYRDAWAVGFNHRFTVGAWIGNLDQRAMDGVTGANGPALILRSVFAELNRYRDTRPLYLSPKLVKFEICRDSGLPADGYCAAVSEWFRPGTEPISGEAAPEIQPTVYLQHPTQGMQLALDPRLPVDRQAFLFKLANLPDGIPVDWFVDNKLIASTSSGTYLWPLERGVHTVKVRFGSARSAQMQVTPEVKFTVK
jgi:penicillin-binding protein 1C